MLKGKTFYGGGRASGLSSGSSAAFGGYGRSIRTARLVIITDIEKEVNVININKTMTLGRTTPFNTPDIPVDTPIVSREHGIFELGDAGFCYRDTNSFNGTFINGSLVSPDKSVLLSDGDVIKIDKKDADSSHSQAVTIIFSVSFDSRSKWRKIALIPDRPLMLGLGRGGSFELDPYKMTNRAVSVSFHCGRTSVQSLINGVFCNSKPVPRDFTLSDRDIIRINNNYIFYCKGQLLYSVCLAVDGGLTVDIAATTVSDGMGKKTLLKDVHAQIDRGDFTLIIGGSGAGKSTFINSILGKYKIDGAIRLDGAVVTAGSPLAQRIAYVPQTLPLRKEERLIDVITDTAILRMNGKMSSSERKKFILDTLDSLGLRSKANMEIKKLSGGEQRRAAIANEVVTNSDIFFLDEPDSGLDPKSGMELMNNLKTLSDKGKMVMLISHNYASYPNPDKIYTKVIILAKSNIDGIGRLAFMGSVNEALEFFGVAELKDITKLINPKSENGDGRADEFVEKYRRISGR